MHEGFGNSPKIAMISLGSLRNKPFIIMRHSERHLGLNLRIFLIKLTKFLTKKQFGNIAIVQYCAKQIGAKG